MASPTKVIGDFHLVTQVTSSNWTDCNMTSSPDASLMTATQAKVLDILLGTVVPILYGLTALIGVCGNSLVIYVILSRQKMRTVTNILLLNLAFADLALAVVIPPATAYSFAASQWKLGDVGCKLMHYLVNVTAYVTVYTLVLISIIRYLTIVHHQRTIQFRTTRNIVIMIVMIWVVVLLSNIPIIRTYGVIERSECDGDTRKIVLGCEEYKTEHAQIVFLLLFVFAYLVPLLIIVIFSICILHHLKQQRPGMMRKRTKSQSKKKKAGRLIILVVVLFAILWLPVHIHLLNHYFGKSPTAFWYQAIAFLFNLLAYFNSCVNPIIYNQASKEFRDAFRETVCCMRRTQGGHTERVSREGTTTVHTRLMCDTNGSTQVTTADANVQSQEL